MCLIQFGSKLNFQQTSKFIDSVEALVQEGKKSIRIDMSTSQYLNSIMLSGLIRALKMCEKAGVQLLLQKVDASAMTLFETTNVLGLFSIENDEPPVPLSSNLSITADEITDGDIKFAIKGSLNIPEQCLKFRNYYESNMAETKNVVLDCSELHHLGSSGVTEMFRLRGILQEKGGKLVIVSETDSVESVWRMMHLDTLIPKVTTLTQARKYFS
jgi:anti-anti-sigma factor